MAQLTIAPQHLLSIARVALGFVLYVELRGLGEWAWALPLAAAAIALDVADGRVARARGSSSGTGRLVDNGSDAVFIAFAFSAFAREIGRAPLVFFALAFGAYALRALVAVLGDQPFAPSPRGHSAGIANYALVVVAAVDAHPTVRLPAGLLAGASAAVALLNSLAFYDNSRLLWQARRGARPAV